MKTLKQFMEQTTIVNAAGKKQQIRKVPVRMANGKIEMQYPGKSGSSGGGGD